MLYISEHENVHIYCIMNMNNSYSIIFILLMNKVKICVVVSWKSKPHKFAKSKIANKDLK